MNDYTNIIRDIRFSKSSREKATRSLAMDSTLKAKIYAYVLKNRGDQDDALSILHDAIIFFVSKVFSNQDFELSTHVHAYLMGTAKNMWRNQLRKIKRNATHEIHDYSLREEDENHQEALMINKEKYDSLKEVLTVIGTKCKEVLMYWASGYRMEEIAELVGFKSDQVARKKKYLCLQKITQFLEDRPDIRSMLES